MKYLIVTLILFIFAPVLWAENTVVPPRVVSDIDPEIIETIHTRLSNYFDNIKNIPESKRGYIIKTQTQKATMPFGYYNPDVQYQQEKNTITVDLGVLTRIHSIAITSTEQENPESLINSAQLKKKYLHQPFTSKNYAKLKNEFIQFFRQEGFRNASLNSIAQLDQPLNDRADITLTFHTGAQFTISKVVFSGDSLASSFLQRFNPIKKNTPYNQSSIQDLRDNLTESGLFSTFTIDDSQLEGESIPLVVHYKTVPNYQYSFGLGYNSNQKIKTSLNFSNPIFNRHGHQLNFNIQHSFSNFSHRNYTFLGSGHYQIPGERPLYENYTMTLKHLIAKQNILDDHTDSQLSIGYHLTYPDSKNIDELSVNYLYSKNHQTTETQKSTYSLFPQWEFTHSWIINPLINISLHHKMLGLHRSLGSDHTAFLLQEELKSSSQFHSFIWKNHFKAGSVWGKEFHSLPTAFKFNTGGAYSIRGYKYNSIGYGRRLYVASTELQYLITKQWFAGVFADFGNASQSFSDAPKKAIGITTGWRNSIGEFSLSLAAKDFQMNQFQDIHSIKPKLQLAFHETI